jgi:NAD(P)-dependent dehydrogenase (short-subunit alcohol dehydrogenase family)
MGVFEGQTAVVTGASSGIGKALCLNLARQRPNLVLAARDEAALSAVAESCRRLGARTLVAPTDVAIEADCRRLVERSIATFGALHVLVNNAGIGMIARFEDVADLSGYERLMRVNYLGCVYTTCYALPELRKTRGRIGVVASLTGLTGVPTRTAYAASKHALFGFYDSLRIELAGSGVSVTMVAPDFVVSEIQKRALGADGRPLGRTPLQEGKIQSAERCAAIIARALARRQRLAFTSKRGRLGRFLRVFAPGLIDRLALRAVERGR